MILMKKLREELGLTQHELYEYAQVPLNHISNAESKGIIPPKKYAERLAWALGWKGDVADLFENVMITPGTFQTCTYELEDGHVTRGCSKCGYPMSDEWFREDERTHEILPDFNYCPNCGRKVTVR